jgi:hypothetical protein
MPNMTVRGKIAVLIVCASELVAEGVCAASFTWNGAASTDWFNTNNWAPPGVPGSNDTVNFSSGTINFTAPVAFSGQFNWSGGTLSGKPLTVASNAVLTISGSSTLYLYGVLTNAGTVNWTETANLLLYNNYNGPSQTGGIVNQPGALFNVQNDQSMSGAGSPYFNNLGTLQKSAGTNTTTLNLPFNNTGGVNVASGTVALAAGGMGSGTITGAGSVSVPGGTFTLNGAAPNLILSGGTINGVGAAIGNLTWSSGTLQGTTTVTGLASWTGGSLGNSGTLTVASNAVLTIGGSSTLGEPSL